MWQSVLNSLVVFDALGMLMVICIMSAIQVVDIGSGRGYLGSHLALMHGLQVIGLDSLSGNTDAATKRNRRMKKQWRGLVRCLIVISS